MPVPVTTEKPSTSETAVTDVDNSGNLAARQACAYENLSGEEVEQQEQQKKLQQGEDEAGKKSKEEADKLYEERIEEEYAKREGGA